jgi:hypothetical protein
MVNGFKYEGAAGFTCVADYDTGLLRTVYPIVGWVSLVCLLLIYGLNGYSLYSILCSAKLQNDILFNVWRIKHKKTSYMMVLII